MARLPTCSGCEAIRALGRIGWIADHQTGSHVILRQSSPPHRRLSVPNHRALAKGLLRALIRDAGLTVDEFVALLRD